MRKLIFLFFLIFSVTACTQDAKVSNEAISTEAVEISKPSEINDVPWMAVVDSTSQDIKMVQSDIVKTEDLDSFNIIKALNVKYPELKIIWETQKNDTLFISIPNANYLTQSSGTMGAKIFMAEVVYSFTQIPGIQFVNFAFKEGDHASPGTFSRVDFPFSK